MRLPKPRNKREQDAQVRLKYGLPLREPYLDFVAMPVKHENESPEKLPSPRPSAPADK